jgi:spoIIIJ-associated protein
MKAQKENTQTLKTLAEELFSLMSIAKAKIEVDYDKENEAYVVSVEAPEETGLLIGKKGETLSSLQTVLGVLLKGKVGEWNRVVVNVGDYREKEEEYLRNLATSTAGRAKETGQPQNLYNLKPWQRRIVHMALSEDKDLTTESMGEGEERYLVVKAK